MNSTFPKASRHCFGVEAEASQGVGALKPQTPHRVRRAALDLLEHHIRLGAPDEAVEGAVLGRAYAGLVLLLVLELDHPLRSRQGIGDRVEGRPGKDITARHVEVPRECPAGRPLPDRAG